MTISKKSMLILAGLAIGGIGVASMLSDADDGGDIPQQIKERAGRVLGSQPTGGEAGAVYNIPAQAEVTFPAMERFDLSRLFALPTEVSEAAPGVTGGATLTKKEAAYIKGAGYGFGVLPSGEVGFAPTPGYIGGVGYGVGVYPVTKKEADKTTEKYSVLSHFSAHLAGKEEAYTSQYDYVKGEGMIPRTTSKKGALTAQGQAVKERVVQRSSGGGSVRSTKKSVSTPKASAKATTRRSSLRDRARAVSQ